MKYRRQVLDCLSDRPHLRLVETNVYSIPERLQEHDPNLFVVFNVKRQKFEIHTLANKDGQTFGMMYPHDTLDGRALVMVCKYDFRIRGRSIIREFEEHNAKVDRSSERQRKNDIRGIAEETRPYFKKLAWGV